MRQCILDSVRDLQRQDNQYNSGHITLDEIAACARISLRQLTTYYTSLHAIESDLRRQTAETTLTVEYGRRA